MAIKPAFGLLKWTPGRVPSQIVIRIIKLITCVMMVILLLRLSQEEVVEVPEGAQSMNSIEKEWDVKMRERFMQRNQLLQENCKKHSDLVITQNAKVPYLHYARDIMYCPISKVGTTTWKGYMFKLIGRFQNLKMNNDGSWFHQLDKTKLQASSHFSDERLFSIMSVDSAEPMIRVLAVRPPLDRLVSVYKDFFEEYEVAGNVSNSEILKSENKGHYEKEETFERWIKKDVLESNPEHGHLNRHMMEYDQLCAPCFFNYDYIVHLYTFEEDVKFIFQVAGITEDMDFKDKFPQSVNSEKTKYEEYFTNLPKDILRGIYLKYRQDFFLFGFEIPDILKEFHTQSWLD